MTKEELEKEAYQYDKEHLCDNGTRWYHNVTIRQAYLAGSEPREKRIAELEKSCDETQELLDRQIEATYKLDKENEELKKENEEMKKDLGCETCQIHLEYKSLNNRIANFERENTELKAGRDINVFTKQLTKAKEIIRDFLSVAIDYIDKEDKNYSLITEAEQFLNSEVENG